MCERKVDITMRKEEELKNLIIRLNKDIHMQVKCNCVRDGVSMNDYVLGLIKKDLKAKA